MRTIGTKKSRLVFSVRLILPGRIGEWLGRMRRHTSRYRRGGAVGSPGYVGNGRTCRYIDVTDRPETTTIPTTSTTTTTTEGKGLHSIRMLCKKACL